MNRKLAAILVGDFVGSTPAMESDEEGTVARVEACMAAIAHVVANHEGRVFSTAGDAVLSEFSSPVNALRAAVEARDAVAALPGLSAHDMRFGIHLADVVVVGEDLRGDGVNVAARLQSSTEAGEIDITGTLYEHVRRVSPYAFDHVGERTVKGVSEPIQVYRVGASIDRHRYQSAPTRKPSALPVRPNSVAVTPFTTASSSNEDQTFLADGLTDDLTLELSRLKGLFVSSRSASTVLPTSDSVDVGKVLGVRYVVTGSVRKYGPRVRLNISLIETDRGSMVWSERIQRPFEEVMDVLDELTARIAATVCGRIEQAELAAARLKRPENMSAYEYYLRGLDHHRQVGVADHHVREAMRWFELSMQADKSFGRAFAMHICSWSALPDFDYAVGERQTAHALDLDPTDPDAHRIMGAIKMKAGDFSAARHHHQKAIDLAPNDAYIIGRCAAYYLYVGEPEQALDLLDRAESLDPFLPVWITEERVAALYVLGRHDEMLSVAGALPFQTRRTLIYQAAAHMVRDDVEQAHQRVLKVLALDATLSADYIRAQELFKDRSIVEALVDRACAAGLPVTPAPPAASFGNGMPGDIHNDINP